MSSAPSSLPWPASTLPCSTWCGEYPPFCARCREGGQSSAAAAAALQAPVRPAHAHAPPQPPTCGCPAFRIACRKYQLIYTYGNVYQTGGMVRSGGHGLAPAKEGAALYLRLFRWQGLPALPPLALSTAQPRTCCRLQSPHVACKFHSFGTEKQQRESRLVSLCLCLRLPPATHTLQLWMKVFDQCMIGLAFLHLMMVSRSRVAPCWLCRFLHCTRRLFTAPATNSPPPPRNQSQVAMPPILPHSCLLLR